MGPFLSFSLLSVNEDKIPAEVLFNDYIQFYLWENLKHERSLIFYLPLNAQLKIPPTPTPVDFDGVWSRMTDRNK